MIRACPTVVVLVLVAAAPARAETTKVIADGAGATGLSAYGGHLVWSSLDPASKQWRLLHLHAGKVKPLPVPARSVPFDADTGPDAAGHPVVVYSACAKEAAPRAALEATGCHIVQVRLDAPGPPATVAGTDVPGTSATTPSRWRGRLAFARHADGTPLSTVVLLRGGRAKRLRGPAVLCNVDCDDRDIATTLESLDLGERAAAFVWRQDGGDTFGISSNWFLAVDSLDGKRQEILSAGFVDGACGYVYPFAPSVIGTGAFWIASGSPCDKTETVFAQDDPRSGRRREARAASGLIFDAARDGRTVFWLRASKRRADQQLGFSPPCAEPRRQQPCAIVRSTGLRWRTVPKGKNLGPYPEDG